MVVYAEGGWMWERLAVGRIHKVTWVGAGRPVGVHGRGYRLRRIKGLGIGVDGTSSMLWVLPWICVSGDIMMEDTLASVSIVVLVVCSCCP